MAILKTLECNRCKQRVAYKEGHDTWQLIYRLEPIYSPAYSTDVPCLCPECCKDLDAFLEGAPLYKGE